ncbi:flavodoxin family protein [Sedimentitalea nanhaiensis]|uniref:Multimeric flavodoxin WrbA n=1 Tax=Sedimentitalea nanhaiensis TaxID=999627 RepID=A0A1I7AK51_9RHOB|nr:flavodoxin family protein [Sedimentitalea nanhaiensis]SFT75215.1 Multimeric flavodoxin WrbA [Sedimentitalea nanhaiensis]
MPQIAIVHHTGYGHTLWLTKAVIEGVNRVDQASVIDVPVAEAEARMDEIDQADAIIMGCPTYMGSVSADMKRFMELTARKYQTQAWSDKIASGFTNSGGYAGDKLSTLMTMAVFAAQHGMTWVSLGLPTGFAMRSDVVDTALNATGAYLGAVSRSPVDVDAEHGLTKGDHDTGVHLGTRVAEITARFIRGRTHSA